MEAKGCKLILCKLSPRKAKECKLIYSKPETGVCIRELPPRLLEFSKDMNFVERVDMRVMASKFSSMIDWGWDKEHGLPNW